MMTGAYVFKNKNWMTEFLTPEVYNRLKARKTSRGCTIDECIQPVQSTPKWTTHLFRLLCLVNPSHPFIKTVGLIAGDEECYSVFAELFNPVISARHNGYDLSKLHFTDLSPEHLVEEDTLDCRYILSCRIRASRNLKGFPLTLCCSTNDRQSIEEVVVSALTTMEGPLKGQYHSIAAIEGQMRQELISDHILFDKPVSQLYSKTKMVEDWPEFRGAWLSAERNLIVWVNEEDHMRVISMQQGGNMKKVFAQFCDGLNKIEHALKTNGHFFMFNDHLGFVSTCPCNLGTGLRASVHLKIPLLSKHKDFDDILETLHLQKRGIDGADSAPRGDIIDISNADRLGSTEVKQVQSVINGVKLLVDMEKALELGEDIATLFPSPLN